MTTPIIGRILFAAGFLALASCGGSSSGSGTAAAASELQTEQKAILTQFSTQVVVPTYVDLALKSAALNAAATTFSQSQTQTNLDATRDAWIATRIPWERSEAFLFGPVDSNGYDPQMDSWPLDHSKLEQTIAANLTSPTPIASAESDIKGFHAIEFILWGFNKNKSLASMTAAEDAYLKALTLDHARVTAALRDSWNAGDKPYASILENAGDAGNDTYTSTQAGIQEMFDKMVEIADEVANSKIAGPFQDQDSNKVESQFSYNSLTDFKDNIVSLRNVYFGTSDGTVASASLSSFVATRDAAVDTAVKAKIDASIAAIGAIPEPFRDSITNPSAAAAINEAIVTINGLMDYLTATVKPIVLP